MSNMSYCRFHNTLADLQDCVESFSEGVSSKQEARARKALREVCEEYLACCEDESETVSNLELNEEGRDEDDDA